MKLNILGNRSNKLQTLLKRQTVLSIQCAFVEHSHYVKEPSRSVLVVHCNTDDWHIEAAKGTADVGEREKVGTERINKAISTCVYHSLSERSS